MTQRRSQELRHPGARPGCKECEGTGFVVARDGERAVARACACVGECPQCRGTGLVAVSSDPRAARRRCACQAALQRMRAFDAVGIPARHADSTRASFVPSSKVQMAVLMAVTKYLDVYDPRRENRGLVLHGAVGRGS